MARKPAPKKQTTRRQSKSAPKPLVQATISRAQVQRIASKAIFDDAFRKRLLSNPKRAAEELNITLGKPEVDYIKSLERDEIDRVAGDVQYYARPPQGLTNWA